MNENIFKKNEILAAQIIKGLESRNMKGYYAADKEEALNLALELIPEGSKVSNGGSASIKEIGLVNEIENGNYEYINRSKFENPREAELLAYNCDVFLGSVNGITYDGILVNIDGNANRVSAYAYGPKKLVLIVGMNKAASDVDSALKRARNESAPINALRFGKNTPCTKTGSCMDCKTPDTVCCQFLITRYSRHADRINVILVNDNIGF